MASLSVVDCLSFEVCRDLFSIRYMVERYRNVELKLAVDESSIEGDRINILLGIRNESMSIISAKSFPNYGTKTYRKPSSLSCLYLSDQHRRNKEKTKEKARRVPMVNDPSADQRTCR